MYADICMFFGLLGDLSLIALVILVAIRTPRKIDRVTSVMEQIRDKL